MKDIIGAKILSLDEIYDYWQIVTDKGTINIYNPSKYFISKENYLGINEVDDIVNAIVKNILYESMNYFKIELNNGRIFETSLLKGDYTGPEAISIHYKTGEIIVFE